MEGAMLSHGQLDFVGITQGQIYFYSSSQVTLSFEML